MIEFHIASKTDGLVILGTTAETPNLTEEEKEEIIRFTVAKVNHRIPVVVGSGSNNIEVTYNASAVSEDEDISEVEYVIMGGTDSIENPDKFDVIQGIQAFANPEVIDINILAAPGWHDSEIVEAGIKVCRDRGDSIFITSTPFGLNAQQAND